MTVSVQWTFAQLNLNVSRTTLGTVIEQIKSQSKYQFFYDDKLATMAVENVKVKNASIEDALNAILKGKNISFKVEDNIVYLSVGDVFGKLAIVTDTHCIRLCNRIGLVDHIKEPKKVELDCANHFASKGMIYVTALCLTDVTSAMDICTTPHCEHCCLQDSPRESPIWLIRIARHFP